MTENWTELSSGAACQEGRGRPQPGCIHTALPSIPLTPSPIRVQRNYLYICINVYLVTLALAQPSQHSHRSCPSTVYIMYRKILCMVEGGGAT